MASLHRLLSEEGFDKQKSRKPRRNVKFKDKSSQQDSAALPIYICHGSRSFESSRRRRQAENVHSLKGSSILSSRTGGSASGRSSNPRKDEPAMDDAAVKAMVSILTGYVGQYSRDRNFRQSIRQKFRDCLDRRRKKHSDNKIFALMEQGIQSIESLVEAQDIKKELDLESLQNAIKILNIVAALESESASASFLSAWPQLYLSIVYKIAKNDKISAKYLLQVFGDSPFTARTYLLPELWEHFFLPHLLHIKIWYNKELGILESSDNVDKEKRIKALNEKYDDQMDSGTTKFALYYKEWLKLDGAQAPPIPSVSLPKEPVCPRSRRRSLGSSTSCHSLSKTPLYQEVFGPSVKGRSMDLDNEHGALKNLRYSEEAEKVYKAGEDIKHFSHVEKRAAARRRPSCQSYRRTPKSKLWPEIKKSDHFLFLACRAEPKECLPQENYTSNNEKIKNEEDMHPFQLNDISRAIATICTPESLRDCEMAIRKMSEAWLSSNGGKMIEISLSQASVIQGILEVLYVSSDDEILELAISILAELATKSEVNRQCILNSDPQLEVSMRLLRSSSLFLKAAALLYIVKPKAKQMVSMEWIPLILRVLEFANQMQILFTVRCSPHEAAYYFLDQLLTGFDEDKRSENARQIISLGGLSLLVKRMDTGDTREKCEVVSVLHFCIEADGSSRHYLAANLKKETVISLLVLGKQSNSHGLAMSLLTELVCLNRRNERLECLAELKKGWDCLNTMHILLFHLQRARPEERPIIAVLLLLLDLMGDPLEFSVYREEAVDAIVKALDCRVFDEKIQEQSAKALLILGGHFSYTGEPEVEKWLLKKAGLNESFESSSYGEDITFDRHLDLNEEEKSKQNWQRKAARVLLASGNRRLLIALTDSIANGIQSLARASLVTVCWMSSGLHSLGDKELELAACSILVPQLIECLSDTATLEEKILASFALLGLISDTDYVLRLFRLEEDIMNCLHGLSRVTWTAGELIALITGGSSDQFP